MENASKALIIAGAILLSILIISLGLIIYNQSKEVINSVNLDAQQIEQFNDKFLTFEGASVSGPKVNTLIQSVISSNQTAINNNTGAYVGIAFPTVSDPTGTNIISILVDDAEKCVIYEADCNYTKASDVPNVYTNAGCDTNPSAIAKVSTSKTYTVTIERTNSIVTSILVKANN